jgi:hypothetical protein
MIQATRRSARGTACAGLVVAVAFFAGAGPTSLKAGTTKACALRWRLVPTPSPRAVLLAGVAAVSAANVWTVGEESLRRDAGMPRVERWNGRRWRTVASVSAAEGLSSVAATNARDVWVVGGDTIEHWNGRAWSTEFVEERLSLVAVSASSQRNAWAVGYQRVLRWDGTEWKDMAAPSDESSFGGVATLAPDDAWAVGEERAAHWDGTRWRTFRTPSLAAYDSPYHLRDVAAISARDVWAVGTLEGGNTIHIGVIVRWDGSRWRRVWSHDRTLLFGIAAVSARDIWVVGWRTDGLVPAGPRIMHWNGRSWREVAGPKGVLFWDVAAVSPRDVWAVGDVVRRSGRLERRAVAAHYACA